ncbi:hypothetical protein EI94DRAFT_1704905 [Lactarius quietus]|nr:hypothetical protein EI94DRAFT_1704905 [Lactarius quietus]
MFHSTLAEASISNLTSWDNWDMDPANGSNDVFQSFHQESGSPGPNMTHAANRAHTVEATEPADAANTAKSAEAADTTDATDTKDTDLQEFLTNYDPVTTNPEEDHTDEAQFATSPPLPPEEGPMEAPPAPPLVEALLPPQLAPLVIDRFLHGDLGAPVPGSHQGSSRYQTSTEAFGASVWAPFRSQCDWEIARWAKMRGLTSSAMEELLAISEVVDKLGLSYSSTRELNHIIDNELSGPPLFECRTLVIGEELLEFYFRDILSCICSIYGDPEFSQDLAVAPERHYADEDWMERVYSEMHTGDWWWAVQTSLEVHRPGATVVPIIISSDKTQLMLFRGRTAYPVYLTIGNIPKDIR